MSKTTAVTVIVIAIANLVLTACGGGGTSEVIEVTICRDVLFTKANVAVDDYAPYTKELQTSMTGPFVAFTNGESATSPSYVLYAGCGLTSGKVTSLTLPGGAVIKL